MKSIESPRGGWNTLLLVAEWALLLAALGLLTVTEEARPYVAWQSLTPWGLLALAVSFAVHWIRTGHPIRRTGLDGPWVLFVLSAGIAAWISYDQAGALLKFARILAALVLYYALVDSDDRALRWAAAGFALAATGLALYWPTQQDFTAQPARLSIITAVGQWINAHVPRLPGPAVQWNVAGGVLVLALPFAVALCVYFWRERRLIPMLVALASSAILVGALFLTGNRGGWLSVAVVTGLAGLVWAQRRWFRGTRRMLLWWGAWTVLIAAIGMGLVITGDLDRLLGMIPDPGGTLQARPRLWAQGLALVRDYLFTGAGLAAFPMVYSTYSILIHTPFLAHIHNTFLEIWIEQGVLGVLAVVWGGAALLVGTWRVLQSKDVPLLGWAGLAALVAVSVHGLFDVTFYGTRMLPLLGLALGCAWVAFRGAPRVAWHLNPAARWAFAGAVGVVLLVAALLFHRPLLSAWHANLGAAAETRAELSVYDPAHFDNPTMDQVRRAIDLSAAEGELAQALEWDDSDLTARQRLGIIALSRGDYGAGLTQLQMAWNAGNRDDETRLLLGDALVAGGRVQEAVDTVRGLTWAEDRLAGQAWYRYWLNKDYRRAADAWAAVLLLNPSNKAVLPWKAEAEKRLK